MTAETTNTSQPPEPPGPPKAPSPTPALALAARNLAALAPKSPSAAGRTVLRQVAADAERGGQALLGIDLVRAYPPYLLMPDKPPKYRQHMGWLGVTRDVFVFAPIILTWLSLFSALQKLETAPPGTNFLELWAADYGIAAVLLVVGLIGSVVVLTVAIHGMRVRADRAASCAGLRRQVGEQLMVIGMELSVAAMAQAAAVPSGQLVRAAGDISRATDRLTRSLEETTRRLAGIFAPGPESGFTQALEKWTESAGELSRMGKSLTVPHQLVKDFAAMRDKLSAEEKATRDSLVSLVSELNEATETSRVSDQAHIRVAEVVVDGTREVREAMERFVERTQLLDMYMRAMTRTLDRLDQGWSDSAADLGPGNAPGYLDDPMGDDGAFDHSHGYDEGTPPPGPNGDSTVHPPAPPAPPVPPQERRRQPAEPPPAPRPAEPALPEVYGDGSGTLSGSDNTDDWYSGGGR